MDAVTYIQKNFNIISDISPKNYTKLARSNIDGRLYVLKFLKVYDVNVYETIQRTNIEGISKIYEVMPSPKGLYVVEEYIEGSSLEKCIQIKVNENTLVGPGEFLKDKIIQLLKALQQLHQLNPPIIHRDIKPDNILVDKLGNVKLIDFNISRGYTGTSGRDTFAMGTSEFAAPEQYGFKESDPRTDIYGVGATVKYLMNRYNIESSGLNAFVERATAFDPVNRFENAEEAYIFLSNLGAYREKYKSNENKYSNNRNLTELNISSNSQTDRISSGLVGADESLGKKGDWKRFLPPGYRTGNVKHIVIGSLGYLMMLFFTHYSRVVVESKPAEQKGQYILATAIYWAFFLSIVLFSFDYLGVQRFFGLQHKKGKEKIRGIIAVDVVLVVIIIFIGVLLINKV